MQYKYIAHEHSTNHTHTHTQTQTHTFNDTIEKYAFVELHIFKVFKILHAYWDDLKSALTRNRDTDVENKHTDTKRGEVVGWIGRLGLTYIH